MRLTTRSVVIGTSVLMLSSIGLANSATVKAGAKCTKAGAAASAGGKSLVCTVKGRTRTWQVAVAPVATAAPVAPAAASGGAATTAPATVASKAGNPALVPGFDGKTISIGILGNVAAGPFAVGGKALEAGMRSYFNRFNESGGVAGKYRVNAIFSETNYDPNVGVVKYAELKDKVVFFGQVFGTPTVTAVAPLLAQDNMVGSPISWDAEWVNKPNLFPNGSTYQGQILNGMDYYINNLGGAGKTICSLTLTSAYGKAGLEGFNFAKGKLNFKVGPSIEVAGTDTNMSSAMATFKAAGCDAISITTAGAQATGALVSGAQSGYTPFFFAAAPSFAVEQLTAATSELYGKYFYVAGDTPQWNDPSTPGFKQMIEDARKTEPYYVDNVNTAFMAGYAEAITDAALLEKAVSLGDLSKDGIKTAMAQVGKVPLGGLFPEYDYVAPEKRVAPGFANIFRADASYPGGIVLVKKAHQSSVIFKR